MICPGGVRIALAAGFDVVVARQSLPWTQRLHPGTLDSGRIDAVEREVVVAFDNDRVVALGDRDGVEHRAHLLTSAVSRLTGSNGSYLTRRLEVLARHCARRLTRPRAVQIITGQ